MRAKLTGDYEYILDLIMLSAVFMVGVYIFGPVGYATLAYVAYTKEPKVAVGVAFFGPLLQHLEYNQLGFAVSMIVTVGAYMLAFDRIKPIKNRTTRMSVYMVTLLVISIVCVGLLRYGIDLHVFGEAVSPLRRIAISFVTSYVTIVVCEFMERKQ